MSIRIVSYPWVTFMNLLPSLLPWVPVAAGWGTTTTWRTRREYENESPADQVARRETGELQRELNTLREESFATSGENREEFFNVPRLPVESKRHIRDSTTH